jgi:hypothetical protein
MNRFNSDLIADLHTGRESWRVFLTLAIAAFIVAVFARLVF